MTLIKVEFDVSQYTTRYYNFGVYCDLLEYQYQYDQKKQILYDVFAHKYTAPGPPAILNDMNPAVNEPSNLIWKFINPTQKIIDRISFWVVDDTGAPLNTPIFPNPPPPAPQIFSYATSIHVLLKKVNSRVIAVSAL
tara:strand:- start:181 stop:591 length:411 start_codon:yes stop_codon:yes gene_type:complete